MKHKDTHFSTQSAHSKMHQNNGVGIIVLPGHTGNNHSCNVYKTAIPVRHFAILYSCTVCLN